MKITLDSILCLLRCGTRTVGTPTSPSSTRFFGTLSLQSPSPRSILARTPEETVTSRWRWGACCPRTRRRMTALAWRESQTACWGPARKRAAQRDRRSVDKCPTRCTQRRLGWTARTELWPLHSSQVSQVSTDKTHTHTHTHYPTSVSNSHLIPRLWSFHSSVNPLVFVLFWPSNMLTNAQNLQWGCNFCSFLNMFAHRTLFSH